MLGLLLATNLGLAAQLLNPGLILLGFLLFLFGVALTLTCLLRQHAYLAWPLLGILIILEIAFLGILVIDLFGVAVTRYTTAAMSDFTSLLSTHRWLLWELPKLATLTAVIVLGIFRERIVERHAREYLRIVEFSVVISFISLSVIALESMA